MIGLTVHEEMHALILLFNGAMGRICPRANFTISSVQSLSSV